MKKLPLILNVALAIAIVVLYILHFTSKPEPGDHIATEYVNADGEITSISSDISIAWVNIDSLLENYDMYFDIRRDLETKGRRMEQEMNTKSRTFEREMQDFQDKVQKGLVTRSQAQQMQQDLAFKEQELYMLRNNFQMEFAEEEQVSLRLIQHSINEFLEEYNQAKGYHFILSSTFGGQMLYGHPAFDITADVVKGINESYTKRKGSRK